MSDITLDELLDRRYIVTLQKGVDGQYHAMARHIHETTADVLGIFDTVDGELIKSTPGKPMQTAFSHTATEAIANLLYGIGDGGDLK